MAAATWIQHELEQLGVPFQELHHDEVYTAQAVAEREHVSGHRVAKVVVVIADGRAFELILPASRRVVLDSVRELLRVEHVRLASEYELQERFADCELGAIPALRHWRDVEVIMDGTLHVAGDILFQAGTHWMQCTDSTTGSEWCSRVEEFTEPEAAAGTGTANDWDRLHRTLSRPRHPRIATGMPGHGEIGPVPYLLRWDRDHAVSLWFSFAVVQSCHISAKCLPSAHLAVAFL